MTPERLPVPLKEENAKLRAEVAGLREQLSDRIKDQEILDADRAGLRARVTELEQEVELAQVGYEGLQQDYTELHKEYMDAYKEYREKLEVLNRELHGAKNEIAAQRLRADHWQAQAVRAAAAAKVLQEELADAWWVKAATALSEVAGGADAIVFGIP